MKTIEDPDVVEAFKSRLEHELIETVRLIDESREYRVPVELDQQTVGRSSRMDAMQQQPWPRISTLAAEPRLPVARQKMLRCTSTAHPFRSRFVNVQVLPRAHIFLESADGSSHRVRDPSWHFPSHSGDQS